MRPPSSILLNGFGAPFLPEEVCSERAWLLLQTEVTQKAHSDFSSASSTLSCFWYIFSGDVRASPQPHEKGRKPLLICTDGGASLLLPDRMGCRSQGVSSVALEAGLAWVSAPVPTQLHSFPQQVWAVRRMLSVNITISLEIMLFLLTFIFKV